jgi:hypothetical protein
VEVSTVEQTATAIVRVHVNVQLTAKLKRKKNEKVL